jgi:predicted nucleotidyltransferase
MSFELKWRNFQRLTEAKEQSQLTSPFQQKMKARRRRNDVYTRPPGHKNIKSGSPFTGKMKKFGTSHLRFEGLQEKIEADALKSFEVHDTLEPEVWEIDKLNPEVRQTLIKIVSDFLIDLEFDIEPEDITLTGSLANYNWSKYSDIDLHIVLDFSTVDENIELVKELFRNLQTNWNNRHDIYMKDYEVEIYFQDSNEPHLSTGIYSIQNDEWITKPEPESVSIDYANVEKKARDISDRISHIEKMMTDEEGDEVLDAIDRLKAKIRSMRQSGLETTGQYSVENLTFKVLRRSEELSKLSDLKVKAYDERMTIPK